MTHALAPMPSPPRRWWRLRWYEVLPEAVLVAGLTFFLVDEPDAATSAFESTRAWVLMVGVGGAWLVLRVLLARFGAPAWLGLAVFGAGAVVVLGTVVVPAYDNDTVVETLPGASRARAGAAPGAPGGESATPQPAPPVVVRTGDFRGIDHRASGTVNLYRRADGSFIVGLEDIDIQPGPDYDVYVVPGGARTDRDRGTRLDDLRGNKGTQFYDVPAGLALDDGPWTVLVWCQTFGVPVANATPT